MRVFALASMLAVLSNPAAAQLDRLFFSEGERRALDLARERAGRVGGADNSSPSIDGMVRRSDGKNTVWINGRPHDVNDRQINRASTLRPDTDVRVRVVKQGPSDVLDRREHRKPPTKSSH